MFPIEQNLFDLIQSDNLNGYWELHSGGPVTLEIVENNVGEVTLNNGTNITNTYSLPDANLTIRTNSSTVAGTYEFRYYGSCLTTSGGNVYETTYHDTVVVEIENCCSGTCNYYGRYAENLTDLTINTGVNLILDNNYGYPQDATTFETEAQVGINNVVTECATEVDWNENYITLMDTSPLELVWIINTESGFTHYFSDCDGCSGTVCDFVVTWPNNEVTAITIYFTTDDSIFYHHNLVNTPEGRNDFVEALKGHCGIRLPNEDFRNNNPLQGCNLFFEDIELIDDGNNFVLTFYQTNLPFSTLVTSPATGTFNYYGFTHSNCNMQNCTEACDGDVHSGLYWTNIGSTISNLTISDLYITIVRVNDEPMFDFNTPIPLGSTANIVSIGGYNYCTNFEDVINGLNSQYIYAVNPTVADLQEHRKTQNGSETHGMARIKTANCYTFDIEISYFDGSNFNPYIKLRRDNDGVGTSRIWDSNSQMWVDPTGMFGPTYFSSAWGNVDNVINEELC